MGNPVRFIKHHILSFAAVMMLVGNIQPAGGQAVQRANMPQHRPNVIFIVADDLNDAVGGMGADVQARTPNLDRLRRMGALFTNAQVNAPICGPSRASFLSGLYPHTTGYYGYNFLTDHWRENERLSDAVVFPEHFRAEGYDVLITGKIYHNNQEDPTFWYETGAPPSWGPWPWDGRRQDEYEHGIIGVWPNSNVHPSLPEGIGIDDAFGSLADVPGFPADTALGVPGYTGWVLYSKPFRYVSETDRDLMPDELNARFAVERLGMDRKNPFLMLVGFNRPHSPLVVPQAYLDMSPLDDIRLPPINENDLKDLAEGLRPPDVGLSTGAYGFDRYRKFLRIGGERLVKLWLQAYLASITFMDDQLGKILDALESSPYRDDTYIVFTSDNGYHIGEKTYIFKNSPWEEACRVPLLVAGPGIAGGQVVEQPVSLVDVYPTLVDWAGLPADPNRRTNRLALDGHSLRPLVEGGEWTGPPSALSSVAGNTRLGLREPGRAEDQFHSLRHARYRYVRTPQGGEELYDHAVDPHEWNNLARDPAYFTARDMLREELARLTGLPAEPRKRRESL